MVQKSTRGIEEKMRKEPSKAKDFIWEMNTKSNYNNIESLTSNSFYLIQFRI